MKEVEEETRLKVNDLVQSFQAIDAKVLQQLENPLKHFEKIRVDLQKKEQALQAILKTAKAQNTLNTFKQIHSSFESMNLTLLQSEYAKQFQSMNKMLASESLRSAVVNMARQGNGIYKPHGIESFTPPIYRPAPNQHLAFEKASDPKDLVQSNLEELKHTLGLEYRGFLITFKANLIDYLDSIEGENEAELFQLAVMQVLEDYQNQALFKHPFCTFPLKPIFHSPKYLETFPTIEAICIPDYKYCTSKKGYQKKGRQPLYLETGVKNTLALADPYLVSFTSSKELKVSSQIIHLTSQESQFVQLLFEEYPKPVPTAQLDTHLLGYTSSDKTSSTPSSVCNRINRKKPHKERLFGTKRRNEGYRLLEPYSFES
jgi:hypothetical protein